MHILPTGREFRTTLISIAIGAAGAAAGWALSLPAAVLAGPALAVTLASLAGIRTGIDPLSRDICFVVLGLGVGAGFDSSVTAAVLHWPMAFAALAVALVVNMGLCRAALVRGFGFDRRTAALASAPGHLSFVMSIAADAGTDVARVGLVQSIRLLALTLLVPFAARAMGFEITGIAQIGGGPMPAAALAALTVLGPLAGLGFARLRLPAPLVIGCMAVSGLAHATGTVEGGVPEAIMLPAFMVLGTMIGTRFSGLTAAAFRDSLLAGTAATLIAAAVAGAAALPVAWSLGIPLAHVLTAFSPGGLETMIALGAALDADPGFIAACHIMRLLILTALIPFWLGRAPARP